MSQRIQFSRLKPTTRPQHHQTTLHPTPKPPKIKPPPCTVAHTDDPVALRRLIETNPINAWTGTGALENQVAFAYQNHRLRFLGTIPPAARGAFRGLVRELVDWRLAEYLLRTPATQDSTGFVMKVSHTGGKPILFLPDRQQVAGVPEGWQIVSIDGTPHRANFVKIAVNVVQPEGSSQNVLQDILRKWFGPDAGRPGTDFRVECVPDGDGWMWRSVARDGQPV